jgi:hypothetical protein
MPDGFWGADNHTADAPRLSSLLRLPGERRGESAGDAGYECAPIHHSITWSAQQNRPARSSVQELSPSSD